MVINFIIIKDQGSLQEDLVYVIVYTLNTGEWNGVFIQRNTGRVDII